MNTVLGIFHGFLVDSGLSRQMLFGLPTVMLQELSPTRASLSSFFLNLCLLAIFPLCVP